MRALVCGSRKFEDESLMMKAFDDLEIDCTTILIHGDCPTGADRMAGSIAAMRGWWQIKCPANWGKLGKPAGPIRNQRMLDEFMPDVVIAFPIGESRGTHDLIDRAVAMNIDVHQYG